MNTTAEIEERTKKIKVAINGFGRIGRTAFRVAHERFADMIEIAAINDLDDPEHFAFLLRHDSNYGLWDRKISGEKTVDAKQATDGQQVGKITVDGADIAYYSTKEPAKLPWKELGIDVVIESTGRFTDKEGMSGHLQAGAKRVVLSAPAKDDSVATFLIGVNESEMGGQELVNNASCTTNSIAPVAKVLDESFGIIKGRLDTVHAYTADQNLHDGPHKDLRRARAASQSIVPTTTGAATATAKVLPGLEGKFDGTAIRVPVPVGSLSILTFLLSRKVTVAEVNEVLKKAADTEGYRGILSVTDEPLVSRDIVGRPESAIVDLLSTQVIDGDLVTVYVWYDNEFGYSNRLIEQVIQVGNTI